MPIRLAVKMTVLEGGAALPVDQPGRRIRELGRRVAGRGVALGLEEQRPARPEAPQHVVEPRTGSDQFRLCGALQVGPAEAEGPLEAAVLIEYHARVDQRSPGRIGKPSCRDRVCPEG